MVVLDQIGRNRDGDTGVAGRLADVVTMDHAPRGGIGLAVGLVIVVALLAICLLVWPVRRTRIAVVILLATIIVLLASPTFFPHYLGTVAVPGAMILGGAVVRVRERSAFRDLGRVHLAIAGSIVLVVELVGLAVIQSGEPVPKAKLAPIVDAAAGCVPPTTRTSCWPWACWAATSNGIASW